MEKEEKEKEKEKGKEKESRRWSIKGNATKEKAYLLPPVCFLLLFLFFLFFHSLSFSFSFSFSFSSLIIILFFFFCRGGSSLLFAIAFLVVSIPGSVIQFAWNNFIQLVEITALYFTVHFWREIISFGGKTLTAFDARFFTNLLRIHDVYVRGNVDIVTQAIPNLPYLVIISMGISWSLSFIRKRFKERFPAVSYLHYLAQVVATVFVLIWSLNVLSHRISLVFAISLAILLLVLRRFYHPEVMLKVLEEKSQEKKQVEEGKKAEDVIPAAASLFDLKVEKEKEKEKKDEEEKQKQQLEEKKKAEEKRKREKEREARGRGSKTADDILLLTAVSCVAVAFISQSGLFLIIFGTLTGIVVLIWIIISILENFGKSVVEDGSRSPQKAFSRRGFVLIHSVLLHLLLLLLPFFLRLHFPTASTELFLFRTYLRAKPVRSRTPSKERRIGDFVTFLRNESASFLHAQLAKVRYCPSSFLPLTLPLHSHLFLPSSPPLPLPPLSLLSPL